MLKRPNIVIFNPDQFRAEALGHLGNTAAVTPNLDSVSDTDGVSFRNAFCQNPVCTPSRCSFMSGWYPHVRGHRTMYHMMKSYEPVLLKTLKDEGYFVWWGGKNDLVPGGTPAEQYCDVRHIPDRKRIKRLWGNGEARGKMDGDNYYSFFYGKLETEEDDIYYDPDWDNVMGAIEMIRNAPEDKPLCIYLPLTYPHPPYAVEEPWYSIIDREKVPKRVPTPENWDDKPSILGGIHKLQNLQGWTEERWTELRAVYYGMCARIDHQFGLLLDALKEAGIYDDTAVFFFSDHGDFTGDYGLVEKTQNTFEDVLTNVPFIIKPPASVKVQPKVSDALVELIDFPATVEDLVGIVPDHTHFGMSLVPLLEGKADEHRNAVFCEGGRLKTEEHCKETQSSSAGNREGLYWPRLEMQASPGPEHSKAVMVRNKNYKYVMRLYEKDELYDLTKDPGEQLNQIDNAQYKDILSELKERLLQFYLETGDVVPHQVDKRGW